VSPHLDRLDGARLYQETHGDPEHPPIVLLEATR